MEAALGLASGTRASSSGDAEPLEAILAHLMLLLNTREGSCLLDPSFGLPDLTDFTHGTLSEAALLSRILSERIARHEPRLHKLTVHAEDGATRPPTLRFAVQARLADGHRLALSACIADGGRVSVFARAVHA